MSQQLTQPAESAVQRSMNRNNYMLSARDIFKTLKELKQNKKLSNRRWVWELLQNAKDVKNDFRRVSVVIEHTLDRLEFRHNGNPFSIDNLTCLIQQVSSKMSDSSDEDLTGKWGTGFISTHLLATIIDVTGVVDCDGNGYRNFQLSLNRSGDTAEELLDSIRDTSRQVLQLEEDDARFPPIQDYFARRQEGDFDTCFSYKLIAPENHDAATAGLADLVHTLPSALINIPKQKIKLVRVQQLDGAQQEFSLEETSREGNVAKYTVTIRMVAPIAAVTQRYFVAYETDDLRLLAEVADFDTLALVPPKADQPVLYRDFPLIGSEQFHFPFSINGYKFYPAERRDGIYLNDANDKEIIQNRELVATAQVAALDFTRWLLEKGTSNQYVLANTRIPETPGDGMDADAKAWYGELQATWRKALLELPLVETEAGTLASLRDVRIPRLRANAKQEENDALWELAVDFLGANAIPRRNLLLPWTKAMGIEEELVNWGKYLYLDTGDLLRLIAEKATLAALPMSVREGGSEAASVAWLNKVYAYLAGQKQLDLLKLHAAVPNQSGALCPLDKLYVERPGELIPAAVLDVLHMLGLPWREDLLRRDVELPDYKHQDRGLGEGSAEINRILKVRENPADTLESGFLKRPDAQAVLVALLRLMSPSANEDAFRSQLFGFAKGLLHFEEGVLPVESLKNFDFSKATQLMTLHLNQTISNAKTMLGLATVLRVELKDDARVWLAQYLRFVSESGTFKPLLEYGNIVPNREGTLCAYTDLFNYGTPYQALDENLLELLHAFDKTKPRWIPRLLMDGFDLILPKGAFKFEELGNEIMLLVESIAHNKKYALYRDQLLNLIDWCNIHPLLAKHYLGQFVEESGRTFYILTIENSNKSSDVVKLLRQPDAIADLVAIAESGTDVAKLRQLAQLTSSDAVLNQVLRFAKTLEYDVASFAFLQSIGAEMERAFEEALEEAGITAQIERGEGTEATVAEIDYQGIGSYDFAVRNSTSGKVFYIELKSYRDDTTQPIRLAQSQAKRAALDDAPFALCVIGRDRPAEDVDAAYVREHLGYVKNLQQEFIPVAEHIRQLEKMENAHNPDVYLDVSALHGSKVFVRHEFIEPRRLSFDALIHDIISAIS